MLGIRATIVMPKDAPKPKRDRTAAFGAEVVLYDRDKGEDREVIARAIATERGAVLVPPYDDPFIIAGQGTAGREIVEDLAAIGLKPDVVVVPNSGGGLTAGVALAVKAKVPQADLYRRACRFRRLHAFAAQRQARAKPVAVGHHLRRADDRHARRNHFRR